MKRKNLIFWLIACWVYGLAITWAGYRCFQRYLFFPLSISQESPLFIEPGEGMAAIAHKLQEAGLIKHPFLFYIGVNLLGKTQALKPGEYLFVPPLSLIKIIEDLASGRRVKRYFTVIPGTTVKEVVDHLEEEIGFTEGLTTALEEGSLLPETYVYYYGDHRGQFVARLQKTFRQRLDDIWKQKPLDSPIKTQKEWIIIASIVEKETALTEERPHVAAVFLNRLQIGMPLQSDPTVIYGLRQGGKKLTGPLTYEDLKTPTPYNTYIINGLPPSPIAIPSLASLKATLFPLKSKDLYFVADGKGGHVFAKTLKEHILNVVKWRRQKKTGPLKMPQSARELIAPPENSHTRRLLACHNAGP